MNRRDAIKYTTSVLGISILGAEAFLSGCKSGSEATGTFSKDDVLLLDEIGETILPDSERSPGAKAARIGEFMKRYVTDCYGEKVRAIFRQGIERVRETADKRFKEDFSKITPAQRLEILSEFDQKAAARKDGLHFFSMMKSLTILGYFTSQEGVTQALRYDPIPGSYDGCIPYQRGEKAWFGPLSSIG